MKTPVIPLISLLIFSISCSSSRQATDMASGNAAYTAKQPEEAKAVDKTVPTQKVSLEDADKAELTSQAAERKIIRNAEITMEVASTTEAQHRVTSIAESYGGFVVTSEAKQQENIDPAKRTLDIKLVVRIPAGKFGVALDEMKQLAGNLSQANLTGQDVTEEFIDLDARIKTQKALELQFLEIMKQAGEVADALEVQRQIADVRTEIERLEGRKHFLENRASLSTITVNIHAAKAITVVTPTGFASTLRDAVSDSMELASGMLIFFVRTVIVMMPILIFVVLPTGLVIRYLTRRAKRIRLAEALATRRAE